MINLFEVVETNEMIAKENLDVRTITLGISLLDCIDSDLAGLKEKIYTKIHEAAKDLVSTGEEIAREFGIPIEQENLRDTHCPGGQRGLQNHRGFCGDSQDPGSGGEGCGSEFYRRVFRTGEQGDDSCGRAFNPLDPAGALRHGEGLQFCESGLYQNGD